MIKKLYRSLACLLLSSLLFSSCSMLTAQGRQERAYKNYVQKSSKARLKQKKLFASRQKDPMPVMHNEPGEPVVTMETGSGPESVSEGGGQ